MAGEKIGGIGAGVPGVAAAMVPEHVAPSHTFSISGPNRSSSMAARRVSRKTPSLQPPRVFRATRGSLGKVIRGAELTEAEAVVERLAGNDIVVCGGTGKSNRALARR